MASLVFDLLFRDHGVRRGLNEVGDATDRTRQRAEKFSAATAAGAAVAAAAIFKFGSDSVKAYTEAQASQLQLQEAFRKFPKLADTNVAALGELNSALAKKTRFDDDATSSGQAVLANFKLTGTQITQLTPLMQDYAAKTGKDIPAAATILGKAMLGNGKALKGIGINFKDAGSTGANFNQVMEGLRTQVGGFAEQEGKTGAGQAEILKNQFGELQETVGEKLLPALLKASEGGLRLLGFIEKNQAIVTPAALGFGGLALSIWAVNKAALGATKSMAAWNIVMGLVVGRNGSALASYMALQKGILLAAGSAAVVGAAFAAVWTEEKLRQWDMANVSVDQLAKGMDEISGKGRLSGAEIELFQNKMQLFGDKVDTSKEALKQFAWQAHDALDQGWSARISRWDDLGKGQKDFAERTAKLDQAFAQLARGGNIDEAQRQFKLYADTAVEAGVPLSSLQRMFPEYTKLVGESTDRTSKLSLATQDLASAATAGAIVGATLASATHAQTKSLMENSDEIIRNKQQLLEHANAVLKNRGSENSFEAATDDATKALKDNGRTLDKHTEKGRENRAALDQIASSTLQWRDAAKLAGKSEKDQAAITEQGRKALERLAGPKGFGMSKKAAHAYADEILGIPKKVSSNIVLSLQNNIPKTLFGVKIGGYGKGLGVLTKAAGGSVRGPGHGTSDSIPAMLSNGEHVWTAREVHAAGGHTAVEGMRRGVLGLAGGGPAFAAPFARGEAQIAAGTSSRLADKILKIAQGAVGYNPSLAGALAFARQQVGKPYIWGGVGPRGYDCSGAMSALLNVVQGRSPYSRRGTSATFPWSAFAPGPGAFMVGSFAGNPGHMAGTINGVNVESSGSVGFHMGRSARGARNPMFNRLGHLRGYARGGPVGDAPFDLLSPRGDDYLGDAIRKVFLADRGRVIQSGDAALNLSGQPERMLSPSETRKFDQLVRVNGSGGSGPGGGIALTINAVGSDIELENKLVRVITNARQHGRLK